MLYSCFCTTFDGFHWSFRAVSNLLTLQNGLQQCTKSETWRKNDYDILGHTPSKIHTGWSLWDTCILTQITPTWRNIKQSGIPWSCGFSIHPPLHWRQIGNLDAQFFWKFGHVNKQIVRSLHEITPWPPLNILHFPGWLDDTLDDLITKNPKMVATTQANWYVPTFFSWTRYCFGWDRGVELDLWSWSIGGSAVDDGWSQRSIKRDPNHSWCTWSLASRFFKTMFLLKCIYCRRCSSFFSKSFTPCWPCGQFVGYNVNNMLNIFEVMSLCLTMWETGCSTPLLWVEPWNKVKGLKTS